MAELERFTEFALINRLTRGLQRHPDQINRTHASDAELVRQPDGSILAATVDTLHEEYAMGLIRDPRTVGWSVVAHSLSDLAAVAATPIGVLLALTFPRDASEAWTGAFFAGVQEALSAHGTFCLGGDTNFSQEPAFTCTALGRITEPTPLQRIGARPGDRLYVTGPLGGGNLLGLARQADLSTWEKLEKAYRPVARLKESRALRPWMNCAIDTSDALLQALAIIADLNRVGIVFRHRPDLYDPRLVKLAEAIRFPLWLVNIFGMGEYELVFTVSPDREEEFLKAATAQNIHPFCIGETVKEPGITLQMENHSYALDIAYLLNLFGTCPSLDAYIKAILQYDAALRSPKST